MRRVIIGLCVLLAGCGGDGFLSGGGLVTLHRNRERWIDLGIRDYDFNFRRSCFCGSESTEPVRVEVRAGQLSRVISLTTAQDVTSTPYATWPTIDSLFVWTERSVGYKYRLTITYDAAHHFPAHVSGDIPDTVDDEFTHTATNLVRR
jgi:hypothetical protein